jgi:hypothetical protein
MPNVSVNGKEVQVNDDILQRIKNEINLDNIEAKLAKLWTETKSGKHNVITDHAQIIEKDLIGFPDKFFEKLYKTHFKPMEYGPAKLSSLLKQSSLDGYLKPEYITDALRVTTNRPAIGRGEFLFASLFVNLGFCKDKGDLVDLDTNQKIEVKGKGGKFGDGQDNRFKMMSKSLMLSLFKQLGIDEITDELTDEYIEIIKNNTDNKGLYQVFSYLQNLSKPSISISNEAMEVYSRYKDLKVTLASCHLYAYSKLNYLSWLLLLNDSDYRMFSAPNSVGEAYRICNSLKIGSWNKGDYSFKITLA